MPKVFLTEQQREEERYNRLRIAIGERIVRAKHREKLTLTQMSRRLGMAHDTVSKLMDGEDVKVSTTTWLRILDAAGISLTAIPDEIEATTKAREVQAKRIRI